jgi:predicted AAA+ superfamily ATPase
MASFIFETAVISEIARTMVHRGEESRLYFWRTSHGTEVDIVVDIAGRLIPIEVKLSATPRPAMAAGIRALQKCLGDRVQAGYVVHPGDISLPLAPDVTALPFARF